MLHETQLGQNGDNQPLRKGQKIITNRLSARGSLSSILQISQGASRTIVWLSMMRLERDSAIRVEHFDTGQMCAVAHVPPATFHNERILTYDLVIKIKFITDTIGFSYVGHLPNIVYSQLQYAFRRCPALGD